MKNVVIILFLILSVFCVSISASSNSDIDEINKALKIWKEIETYVNKNEFVYGVSEENKNVNFGHIDKITEILKKYNIDKKNYFAGILADASNNLRPMAVIVIFKINKTIYKRFFTITKVKELKCYNGSNCI
jgi:hypothetical protein